MSFSAPAPSDDEVNAARLDPARLQAVCDTGLLDTPAEESFDRLTRLATRLLEVPATFVSLVDAGRDFYKSTIGFGEPLASARQLQGRTFCHYALLSQGPLLLDDVCALPGFADVPTVQTLGVRAYAGVPLVTPEGLVLGSFCAVDMQPRHWTARDVEVLTELAHATLREITLRQALTQLAETNRLLAEEMHKVGVLNERLSELAHTDALTGLNNRRAYDQQLAREWRRVQRNGAPLSVLLSMPTISRLSTISMAMRWAIMCCGCWPVCCRRAPVRSMSRRAWAARSLLCSWPTPMPRQLLGWPSASAARLPRPRRCLCPGSP